MNRNLGVCFWVVAMIGLVASVGCKQKSEPPKVLTGQVIDKTGEVIWDADDAVERTPADTQE